MVPSRMDRREFDCVSCLVTWSSRICFDSATTKMNVHKQCNLISHNLMRLCLKNFLSPKMSHNGVRTLAVSYRYETAKNTIFAKKILITL